jgi:hypothetical protein
VHRLSPSDDRLVDVLCVRLDQLVAHVDDLIGREAAAVAGSTRAAWYTSAREPSSAARTVSSHTFT